MDTFHAVDIIKFKSYLAIKNVAKFVKNIGHPKIY